MKAFIRIFLSIVCILSSANIQAKMDIRAMFVGSQVIEVAEISYGDSALSPVGRYIFTYEVWHPNPKYPTNMPSGDDSIINRFCIIDVTRMKQIFVNELKYQRILAGRWESENKLIIRSIVETGQHKEYNNLILNISPDGSVNVNDRL